jgi:EcsC protein family
MSTPIKAARPRRTKPAKRKLTAYESEQVERIAAWKSKPPNPFDEMAKKITGPVAHWVERLIPDAAIRVAIERAYDLSQRVAGQEDIKRQAGVTDLAELRKKPLEECDQLAVRVSRFATGLALAEGAATGAGGFLTTFIDGPLLFVLTLRTIMRIGHCYGYALDHRRDQAFVLGVYLTAVSGTLHTKRRRLEELKELEELLISETQREILAEEFVSFVFQLEIFEEVPGVGAVSGALLNLGVMRKAETTARRVFQERWLRDNGKVRVIAPAPAHERAVARGWAGVLERAAYSGCYGLGFAAVLPGTILASLFRPMNNALTQGTRDGAAAAVSAADKLLGAAPSKAAPARRSTQSRGALVPG